MDAMPPNYDNQRYLNPQQLGQLPDEHDGSTSQEPLLIASMPMPYNELVTLVSKIAIDHSSISSSISNGNRTNDEDSYQEINRSYGNVYQQLPYDLALRIVHFLTIDRVCMDQVDVTNCSSHDRAHPLKECLVDSETTWWISAMGSMINGHGREWVAFKLGSTPRRLSAVMLKIPPLPNGPLSVRHFVLEQYRVGHGWSTVTPVFMVDNIQGWQTFPMEQTLDVKYVRIVCLSNQVAAVLNDSALDMTIRRFQCVGFFAIKFA